MGGGMGDEMGDEMGEGTGRETVENMLEALGKIGQVKIHKVRKGQRDQKWCVQVEPEGWTPLWWYACESTLSAALDECVKKAEALGFIRLGVAA
jgi:hypothetical protein